MKGHKYYLFLLLVLMGFLGCFLLRVPSYKNLSSQPEFFGEDRYFCPFKIVQFSSRDIPQMEIEIEGNTVLSKLDLGFNGFVVVPQEIIEVLKDKCFLFKTSAFGVRGKTHELDVYEVPEISIGNMRIFPMRIQEKNEGLAQGAILVSGEQGVLEDRVGKLGWHVFRSFNLFLDCDHYTLAVCDSLATLKEQGFPVDSFIEAPLLLDRDTIDFEVITEEGALRCMLDTGCTKNMLNKDFSVSAQDHRLIDLSQLSKGKTPDFNPDNEDLLVFNPEDTWISRRFQINQKDFGPVEFMKMKSPLGLDAIIGMEFVQKHLIFIDFKNEKIYFSKLPEECSVFKRICDFLNLYRNSHSGT